MPSEQPREDDQEQSEIDYMLGNRMAWLKMLRECLSQLGYVDSKANRAKWVQEREETVAMLRMVCKEHGDNNWENNLHLADVIEKHLARHL